MKSLTLYELNSLIRQTLEVTMFEQYWLCTEISSLNNNRGHCFLELVQKDDRGNGIIAKASAHIWANKWIMIKDYFKSVTGQSLSVGMQVLIKVEITFHELYGYALNVVDVDPTYTLGDIARRRMEIIQALKDEGVFEMNKELPLPRLLQRIAVISSQTAAGYGDFCNQLYSNESGLAFSIKLFPATMQGNDVERSVIEALEIIAKEQDNWDVVVIIRGGGSSTDLSGFDTLALGENVAQFPLPIITGIGHERDDTIIDLVSHTRVKTPTAAAEFLIHHQKEELSILESMQERLYSSLCDTINNEKHKLQIITNKLPSIFNVFKSQETARIDRILLTLQKLIVQKTTNENALVDNRHQRIITATNSMLTMQNHKLEMVGIRIESADPQHILNLGFSITRVDGTAVKDASTLKKGQIIETTFNKGIIKSTIQ